MCGIYCSIRFKTASSCEKQTSSDYNEIPEPTKTLLNHRGPDSFGSYQCHTSAHDIFFAGFVLWQQGWKLCEQPIIRDNGVLLFNGDIYMDRTDKSTSDTVWLIEELGKCKHEQDILDLFKSVQGPYSIIYYNSRTDTLYMMRDSLGRQSLLFGWDRDRFIISSIIATPDDAALYGELPPVGIFKIKNKTLELSPWHDNLNDIHHVYGDQLKVLEQIFENSITIRSVNQPSWLNVTRNPANTFCFPKIIPGLMKDRPPLDLFENLLENQQISDACETILNCLRTSIRDRIETTPDFCKECLKKHRNGVPTVCAHAKIGILFSGGIDCTILAVLANRFVSESDPIDLLNVSFEKVARTKQSNVTASIDYRTPDRISALETVTELRRICPERQWNLVEINVTRNEREKIAAHTVDLIFPLKTVLDESLATALWFAATGNGLINGISYKSVCRVLFIGSGADELFGGYTRHRNAYIRNRQLAGGGWTQLDEELHHDWIRLPSRNLARDDRALGDHGITARAPYVHECLTAFVRSLSASQKCYHDLEQGVGDKLLLRLCGYRLGLREVCCLKKRALQFGSRVADSRENAKDLAVVVRS